MAEMTLNEALLATIVAEAAAQNLNMKELAAKAGMPYDTWRNHYSGARTARGERKKRALTTDAIMMLANGLGMTDDELLALAFERRRRNDGLPSK